MHKLGLIVAEFERIDSGLLTVLIEVRYADQCINLNWGFIKQKSLSDFSERLYQRSGRDSNPRPHA